MSYYYPGYYEARENVQTMDLDSLLSLIDALYGRDNLKYGDTVEDVRAEALHQLDREFTDTSSEEYKRREFWRAVMKTNRGY